MRKIVLAFVAAALFGMTAGYAGANEGTKGSGAGGSTDSSTGSMDSGSATGSGAGSATKDTAAKDPAAESKTITGWSAKKMILGKDVYNETNDKIGKVHDLIINQEKAVSYAIIGVGGFIGMGEHYVAVPVNEIKMKDKKLMMSGASKDKLKQMPKFEYTKKK